MVPDSTQDLLDFSEDDLAEIELTRARTDFALENELDSLFDFHVYGTDDSATFCRDDENVCQAQASSHLINETSDQVVGQIDVNVTNTVEPSMPSAISPEEPTPPYRLRRSMTSGSIPAVSPLKRKHKRDDSTSKYPSDSGTDEDGSSDEDSDCSKTFNKRRHRKGHNASTGELTLVGRFPPRIRGGKFVCPAPNCRRRGREYIYNSQNGYKYHLKNGCIKTVALRLAEAGRSLKFTGRRCDLCGARFESEEAYIKHRQVDSTTSWGKCIQSGKKKRKLEREQRAEELDQMAQGVAPSQLLTNLVDPQLMSEYLVTYDEDNVQE